MDGVSGVDLTAVLFDLDREPAETSVSADDWVPGPEPSDAELVAQGVRDLVKAPFGLAGAASDVLRRPARRSSGRARWPRAWARWPGGS